MNITTGLLGHVLFALTTVISISVFLRIRKWRQANTFYVDAVNTKRGHTVRVRIDIRVLRSHIRSAREAQRIGQEIQQTLAYGSAYAGSKGLPDKLSGLDDPAHEQELQ